ncbi:hypothetical protein SAMN06297251_10593 [Fulvimarina manganoxydans]|uniref:Yip1 domain-containing protein n=2 Tax=Fulvimarina manganoxydans TaxID=937218 RepID=A0A1W2AV53_9HYPH|nr:hypothetical protein [Fulvimarina manganoxydans]SMC64382.1 hypothetical protein SAMN06297251_10593 [Fulvimarina manganoxydans]
MTNSYPAGSPPSPSLMPTKDEVLRYFSGVALMMLGRKEGLARLDISPDGFWQSFYAIAIAAPAIAFSWIEYESMERSGPVSHLGSFQVYGAHALADALAWLVPVLFLMMIAKRIGYGRKVSPLVVATNWAGALIAWALAPYLALVVLFGMNAGLAIVGTILSWATLILTARLIQTVVGDWAAAIGITVLMLAAGLVSYGAVIDLTGVPLI